MQRNQVYAPGMPTTDHPVLSFWFGTINSDEPIAADKQARWWKKSVEFDTHCRGEFEEELAAISRDEREHLKSSTRGLLAYILLCDQLPRNIHRDTPKAFAWDPQALAATMQLIEGGELETLHANEHAFALMPLMHAEDREVQVLSLKMFTELAKRGVDTIDYAQAHKDIIDRFGHYPHRNAILGRNSTPEELSFLEGPGSSF